MFSDVLQQIPPEIVYKIVQSMHRPTAACLALTSQTNYKLVSNALGTPVKAICPLQQCPVDARPYGARLWRPLLTVHGLIPRTHHFRSDCSYIKLVKQLKDQMPADFTLRLCDYKYRQKHNTRYCVACRTRRLRLT